MSGESGHLAGDGTGQDRTRSKQGDLDCWELCLRPRHPVLRKAAMVSIRYPATARNAPELELLDFHLLLPVPTKNAGQVMRPAFFVLCVRFYPTKASSLCWISPRVH